MICNLGIHKRYKNFYLSVSIYNQKDEIIEVYDVAYYDIKTSVYYCKSRYYVPEWGRFLTPDSFEYLDPTSIIGLKLFAYCSNDPINKYDPTGQAPWWSWLLSGLQVLGIDDLKNDEITEKREK